MDDPHDLMRFVAAQAGVYDRALSELRAGRKRGHWMWFVFPQIDGLGGSAMARAYAIASLDEARAFHAHPLLGPRLHACTAAVDALRGMSAAAVFGHPDDLKFRSCMTLFARAAGPTEGSDGSPFDRAIARWFDGRPDPLTLERLRGSGADPR